MLQRMNTVLLLATLAAVVWFGMKPRHQPQVGRYTGITWDGNPGILDTATGELTSPVPATNGTGPVVVRFDSIAGRLRIQQLDRRAVEVIDSNKHAGQK
jgi:hypothetical protein